MWVCPFTLPTCPDCHALRLWFARRGLSFEERDPADLEIVQEAKAWYGVRVVPTAPMPTGFVVLKRRWVMELASAWPSKSRPTVGDNGNSGEPRVPGEDPLDGPPLDQTFTPI
ncbi:glutaredoxin family protein [Deinococcus hopiensis]|uniref:Glutaredoxin and related proteins n=1 Tax=Deinococcus hopiensis KR-140 TaxID=695939 RepID=A0A1W1UT44_9DEIO|nr:glutaredoxin [Deinococcus hopiensis]SMB84223.1 Glutaredoxin and related proteins [Deinococcus hopiensis KR-140]